MANNSWVVRCFDTFDNTTLGYRFFADELTAKKVAEKYESRDKLGNGYAVYERKCWLRYTIETPNGEYPMEYPEIRGSFSDLQREFGELIKNPLVMAAEIIGWFDATLEMEKKYYYVRLPEFYGA